MARIDTRSSGEIQIQFNHLSRSFDPNQSTYVLTHGFQSSPSAWANNMGKFLLYQSPSSNVITVDWSKVADKNLTEYSDVVKNVPSVGSAIANYLKDLGINPQETQLIGHSLGAHASGIAGDLYNELTGYQIDTIVGLDPAGPEFEPDLFFPGAPEAERLDRSDANRVIAFHTSPDLGYDPSLADLDLYVNRNRFWSQPGQWNFIGDHSYATELYYQLLRGKSFTQSDTSSAIGPWFNLSDLNLTGAFDIGTFTEADINHNLKGGNGNDTLKGRDGNDTLKGRDGNDLLLGRSGDDSLEGGNGADKLYGENGNDILYGGNGADKLYGGNGDDYLEGGDGADKLYGGNGNDYLSGYLGNDILNGNRGSDILYGYNGDDYLEGGDGADKLYGGDGNDILNPGGYNYNPFNNIDDVVDGGTGDDLLQADYSSKNNGYGVHLFDNGNIHDQYTGKKLVDVQNIEHFEVTGTQYADVFEGRSGNDIFNGGSGNDYLYGETGTDTAGYIDDTAGVTVDLSAGTATDGSGSTDTLNSIENVIGSDFDDHITGDGIANNLSGNSGNDSLSGGSGNDTLSGGIGADRFTFNSDNQGIDTITDFSSAEGDTIQINRLGFEIVIYNNNFELDGGALYFNRTLNLGFINISIEREQIAILDNFNDPTFSFDVATDIVLI